MADPQELLRDALARIAALELQLAESRPATPLAPPVTPRTRGPKIAVPSEFNGDRANTETFLRQVLLYLLARPYEFADDDTRVMFAMSYMKDGTAGLWADRKVDQYQLGEPIPSWTEFIAQVRDTFGDPDRAGSARLRMGNLSQGSKSADEYVQEFREVANLTLYNDEAHIDRFQQGLNRSLVEKIYSLPHMPADLEAWYKWASKLDNQARMMKARFPSLALPQSASASAKPGANVLRFARPPTSPMPAVAPPTTSSTGPAPMDLDRARRTGACFLCGKVGHIKRDCPSRRSPQSVFDATKVRSVIREELQRLIAPPAEIAGVTRTVPQDFPPS